MATRGGNDEHILSDTVPRERSRASWGPSQCLDVKQHLQHHFIAAIGEGKEGKSNDVAEKNHV